MQERTKLTKRHVESIKPDSNRDVVEFDSELRGFGVRVWPSGKRVYFVKYRTRDGRQRKLTIGTHGIITAEQARTTARQCLADALQGEDPAATRKAQREAPTMAQLAERYLVEHARPHKKSSSVANDERLLAKKIIPELGPLKAHAVTRADVARLHRSFQATPFEANRLLALLSKIFTLAEEWHVRPQGTNPCRGLKRFKEPRRQLFLSELQLGRLGRALSEAERDRTEPPSALMAVRLLLFTGCRLSEILTLSWDEVDLERGYLHLSDSKTGKKDVPLNAQAIAILAEAKRDPENPYVIPGRKPGAHLVNLELAWRRIRDRAGLKGIRLHDLRHTFASTGASNGVSLPLLGALLGHTQPATTNRYAHCAADPVRQANELVGQYLAAKLSPARAKIVGDDGAPAQTGGETARVARSDPRYRVTQGPPLPIFTDEDMASICREIRAAPDPEQLERLRKRLVSAGAFYRTATDTYAETRSSQVLREARRLAKAASELAEGVEHISSRTRFSAISAAMQLAKRYGDDWFNRMQAGLELDEPQDEDVDELGSRAATQCLCDLKGVYRLEAVFSALARASSGDKGGRVRDRVREGYLRNLAEIYEETTGTSPRFKFSYDPGSRSYWGPFFSFVKRNLDIVRPDHGLSNAALGSLLNRVIPKRPKTPATG